MGKECVVPCSGREDYISEIQLHNCISMAPEGSEDFLRCAVYIHRLHLSWSAEARRQDLGWGW